MTKKEMAACRAGFIKAIVSVRTQTELASRLGVTNGAITQWGGVVPTRRVVQVEAITGVPRADLRPDLFQ